VSPTIDPDLDFASHYLDGGDPDRDSQRLYQWHRLLWSRPVSGVTCFELEITFDRGYGLNLRTDDGSQFRLGSDGIIPTWSTPGWTGRFAPNLVTEILKDTGDFYRLGSTIGGYLLFPRNRADQSGPSLNQARGTHPAIADRFDLTLECIRRHYDEPNLDNPLGDRLDYYGDFFGLFGDFDRYVRFFLLDDLVADDRLAVLSLMTGEPVAGFQVPAYADSPTQYARYRQRSIDFVTRRNDRIRQFGL
jgi:hypothetical protein